MTTKTYVMYHAGCLDGFGAAWAAHSALGDKNTEYLPASYGSPIPNFREGSRIFILDFSYPRKTMLELMDHHDVILLDHHESAHEEIGDLPVCRFDFDHSGAVLAWQHFHPDAPAPTILLYVEDRDLWKFQLPHSREVDAALQSFQKDFCIWDALGRLTGVGELAEQGRPILRNNQRLTEVITAHPFWLDMLGNNIPAVNTPVLASEACEKLLADFPHTLFAAAYSEQEGRRRWSLRSREGSGIDVSRIAKLLGGGGHPHAAGFNQDLEPGHFSQTATAGIRPVTATTSMELGIDLPDLVMDAKINPRDLRRPRRE